MRVILSFVFLFVSLAEPAFAADRKHMQSIAAAMSSDTFKERLNPDVKLYFGKQAHAKPIKTIGTWTTNKKSRAFGKSDKAACEWVLLSALLSLQDRALAEGGNAVVDIESYYKKNTVSSKTEYECHAGAIVVGVALKGKVVKLP